MADHTFLAMWDCYGLEYLADITEIQGQATWAALKGEKYISCMPSLGHLELRARYNSHRHYEIYAFDVAEGITETDLREMFEQDPQYAADLIRSKGQKIYSDRRSSSEDIKIR